MDGGEVLTTDNHSVNTRMGSYNPVGLRVARAEFVAMSRRIVEQALANLQPVKSEAASGTVHGLRVFGHENTVRLTSSVDSTLKILRPTAILTLGSALAISVLVLALFQ